ncbi:MAG: discoidin domain-containing protein [Planctomycetota bacterium]|nr:discoidin domain-containing protein [Planctomycetota bacterium]
MKPLHLIVALSVLPSLALGDEARVPKPLKALLITGGCCHDYTTQKQLIKQGLEERAHIEVTVVQQGGTTTDTKIPLYEDPNWADGYDIVLHDECFSDVPDPAWTQRILKPHQAGLPGVVIHCAMHCYRDGTDEWFKFCGVTSRRHGAHYAHEVLNRDAEHPIMKNFGAGWANPAGELYWIEKVWPTAHPLAASKNREKGNEEVCVWTNDYQGTRIFGTTLGHHNETVEAPAFLNMLTRGTLWACGKLDDTYLKPVEVKLVPVNLALNKPTSASSEETGKNNFAPHAVDGNKATRWCASNPSAPQWWQVDLEKPQHVTGCRLDWENPNAVFRYKVEGSNDGEAWITLVDRSNNEGDKNYTHEFNSPSARYLRVTFLGSDTGNWGSLWEVSAFGDETVKLDPDEARVAAEQAQLADVKLPAGFEATLFATPPAVNYPVFVAAAPDGTAYVSVDKNGSLDREPQRGSVYRLRDIDGDGRADESKLFVADVDSPRGLVWDHDRLYLMHPPHLSAFIDHDGDGIADEQQTLVKNIAFTFKDRPADHTSNGVTLGIDGWLYLAIGDFGFMEAEGTDGRKLQLRGGGVVRVRPDGTGLELYSRGTRNILEVAVDPLLNGFTRDNTNDGGGWDIRLHHFTGWEDHGYPRLFTNFGDEIVQPLADYGGGSGCGALYLDEPGFPPGYGNALYTADWGLNWIYRHELTPRGATFTPSQDEFVGATRVTDLDVDAMSRLYITSWKGATFKYEGDNVGYLIRVSPKGYQPESLPDFEAASDAELVKLLESPSHRRRLEAQRTLIRRVLAGKASDSVDRSLSLLAADDGQPLASRIAAVFALKQAFGSKSHAALVGLTENDSIRPFAIRALTDRDDQLVDIPLDPIMHGLFDENSRSRLEACLAMARLKLIDLAREMTPLLADPDPIVAHTAVQALVSMRSAEACFVVVDEAAVDDPRRVNALRVLQSLHGESVVSGLVLRLERELDTDRRRGLLTALCRLYHTEGEWTGNSWGTRPDTRGPYYQPERWSGSDQIGRALKAAVENATGDEAAFLLDELARHRVDLAGTLDTVIAMAKSDSRLLPAAVAQLARARDIPRDAVGLLAEAASSGGFKPQVRSQAAIALLKVNDPVAFETSLSTIASLHAANDKSPEYTNAWDALTDVRVLQPRTELLIATANATDAAKARLATGCLLVLASAKETSPEVKTLAGKFIEAAWSSQRAQVLEAALLANARELEPNVRAALKDTDAAVATAARQVAAAWKLEPGPTPAGPPLKNLKPEDVIAAAMKEGGDVGRGEQVYVKLNCAKCHTVKEGEPSRGPHLPLVVKTYKRNQLAESILLPSKTIAQGFVTNLFLLDNGKTLTGFVTNEAADEVTIRDNEGKEIKIPAEQIEERVKQDISVMPKGLADEISVKDFVSLVDYLESLR